MVLFAPGGPACPRGPRADQPTRRRRHRGGCRWRARIVATSPANTIDPGHVIDDRARDHRDDHGGGRRLVEGITDGVLELREPMKPRTGVNCTVRGEILTTDPLVAGGWVTDTMSSGSPSGSTSLAMRSMGIETEAEVALSSTALGGRSACAGSTTSATSAKPAVPSVSSTV